MEETTKRSSPINKTGRLILIFFILVLAAGAYFIYTAAKEAKENDQTNSTEVVNPPGPPADKTEPTNPNVTGGSSGTGTGESNDEDLTKPSPAGGADSNNDLTP